MTRADLHHMVVRANRCFITASIVLAGWGFAAIAIWCSGATLWLRLSASLAMLLAAAIWVILIIRSGWERSKMQVAIYFQEESDA